METVIANPPFSAKWSADVSFMDDERFSEVGKLAPKSKADYAFVLDIVHKLDVTGIAAIVLPHGVLFRGAPKVLFAGFLLKIKTALMLSLGYRPIYSMVLVFLLVSW